MSTPRQNDQLLSPTSPQDFDSNNGMDTFPPLTETPAAMSPVPASLDQDQPGSAEIGQTGEGEDDDTWSTDSELDDDYESAVQRMAASSSGPLDSRSIYHALFGGGGPPQAPRRKVPAQRAKKLPAIPVYKLALGAGDVESCVKLEEACFSQGASKDKIAYRIAKASGLNVGLFTTVFPEADMSDLPTYSTSSASQEDSARRTVLVAYIIATQTTNDRICESDDALPPEWQKAHNSDHSKLGHQPFGKTVIVHSFGVLPELRHKNIGTCLWKSFTQMIKSSKSYSRIAMAVSPEQVPWFKKHKFRVLGPSVLKDENGFAKLDMVSDYNEDDDSEEEDDDGEDGEEEEQQEQEASVEAEDEKDATEDIVSQVGQIESEEKVLMLG